MELGDDHRSRVDELFEQALELAPAERAGFLAAACDGRPELRQEIEELLALTAEEGPDLGPDGAVEELRREALAAAGPPVGGVEAGRRFGPWQVAGELGRGGMGTVYRVERADGQFRQQAALKLVRAGADTADAVLGFERERQILASLSHANIARLLDGGRAEDGRPFFVMELVQGRPIDRWCDERRLTVDERLALFLEVARAVEHAHRNLVVHRDVKPSNIAVTHEGEVKLLDFGIAKLYSPAAGASHAITRPLARILTPEYASPEQVRGDAITTASDVYQLGLLLSELLTGQKAQPVTATTPSAIERAICESPATRPSAQVEATAGPEVAAARRTTRAALARKLTGDLDAIVLCALRKEPERRYASVGDLIDDVERHRQGLPIGARPDTLAYRTRKFVARHRVALAWGLVFAVAAGWGVAVFARQRLRVAAEARKAAEIERLLGQLFNLSNPRLLPEPLAARDYVEQAARLVRAELRDQPVSQGRLLALLGRTDNALGFYAPSAELLAQALALQEKSYGRDGVEVADTLQWLAQSQHYLGLYDPAEADLARALAIHRQHYGGEGAETVRTALALGDLQHTRGRLTAAEATLRGAIAVLRRPEGDRTDLTQGLRDLGNVLRDRGALAESEACYREAIAILSADPRQPEQLLVTAEVYFGRLLVTRGKLAEAESLLLSTLVRLRRIYAGDHPITAVAVRDLGYLRLEQGRWAEAEARLDEALRILHHWLGEEHPVIPRTTALQAELARRRGRPEEAVGLARATLADFARFGLAEHPSAIDACLTLGEALAALGRRQELAATLAPCLAVAEREFVASDPRTVRLRRLLLEPAKARAPAERAALP